MIRVSARAHFVARGAAVIIAGPFLFAAGVLIGLLLDTTGAESTEIQHDEDHAGITPAT